MIAKIVAIGARNGVEDLHAAGAFSDPQAPAFNRRIRNRAYETLLAVHHSHATTDADWFTKYVDQLADGHSGGRTAVALRGAIERAVDDFADAEAIDQATARKLRRAAVKGAVDAYTTLSRLSLGRSKDQEKDQRAVEFWLRSIPSYWEEPEVSPEFQTMLDSKPSSSPHTP